MARPPESIWEDHWRAFGASRKSVLAADFAVCAYGVLRRIVGPSSRSVLEAGCGTGRFCYLLAADRPEAKIVGLDSSARAVARAREMFALPNLSFIQGDLFRLPYEDGTWDVVFNEGVIEHFPVEHERSYVAAVREMARVAKPGGQVIVGVPNFYCIPHTMWKAIVGCRYEYGYEKSFRPAELRLVMEGVGLKVEGWVGVSPLHGLNRYRRLIPRLDRVLRRCQRAYPRAPRWVRRILDVFGHEFFMWGVKT